MLNLPLGSLISASLTNVHSALRSTMSKQQKRENGKGPLQCSSCLTQYLYNAIFPA